MITVYVREIDQTDGQNLGEFTPEQIKPLVETFKWFPTMVEDRECLYYGAQYVANAGTYFEIIVEAPKVQTC